MVNKTEKVWNLQKAFSPRTIEICQFEIIDGVKCLLYKTRLQISSEGTSRVCGGSLTLASVCFLLVCLYTDLSKIWILTCAKNNRAFYIVCTSTCRTTMHIYPFYSVF